ncbi:unnamed protein product [Linum tenue]|uniref:Uncharacterized protein n=1 Tax=Linum tenue TaxID=586396 RepID=A0AAV0RQG1_9ROSI|nr:unnamed protein product [Linum tenue]
MILSSCLIERKKGMRRNQRKQPTPRYLISKDVAASNSISSKPLIFWLQTVSGWVFWSLSISSKFQSNPTVKVVLLSYQHLKAQKRIYLGFYH